MEFCSVSHTSFLQSNSSLYLLVSENIFKISANQKLPMATMFFVQLIEMMKFYRGISIDASYKVLVHTAEQFQRRRFKCEKLIDAK